MKFKYVPTAFIPYKDEKVICFDKHGYFETDDKMLIEFLKNYEGVEVVEDKKEEKRRGRPPKEVKPVEVKEEKEE